MTLVTPQVHGLMFIPRVMQTLLVARSVPPLPICQMALVVQFADVETVVQRKSCRNNIAFFVKLSFRRTMFLSAYVTLKMTLLFLTVVICPVLQLPLPRLLNGDVITYPIFIFTMIHKETLVSPSAVLMAVFLSFVSPEIRHLTSLGVVDWITYTRHFKPVKISGRLSVVATRNAYLQISARPPSMHVLDLRYQGTARRFTIIHPSWTNFQATTGSLCCG